MEFTNINYDSYIKTDEVKFVLTKSTPLTHSVKHIVDDAKRVGKYIPSYVRKATNAYVVTDKGFVYESYLSIELLLKRFKECGKDFVTLSSGNYISAGHISAVLAYTQTLVVKYGEKTGITNNVLQFVRQSGGKNSVILTTDNEMICLSEDTSTVVKELKALSKQ